MRPVWRSRVFYSAGVLAGALLLAGCPKRPEVAQAGPAAVGPAAATAPAPTQAAPAPKTAEVPVTRPAPPAETGVKPSPAVSSTEAASALKDIFFDFDKSAVRSDQRAALEADFTWLTAHPAAKVRVEGNCDERGTEEYNIALGERRAQAVKNDLVARGIATDRISILSYGKDKPFALGHDEKAWKLNRRDHFVLVQ